MDDLIVVDGSLQYYRRHFQKRFSENVTVLDGVFNSMVPVTVKRIKFTDDESKLRIEQEIKIRQKIDILSPFNFARFYHACCLEKNYYIATEKCQGTLLEYFESDVLQASYPDTQVFHDIVQGVDILHSQPGTAIELSPSNVYFKAKRGQMRIERFLLCDFYISSGLTESRRQTDLINLGNLFYYIATKGARRLDMKYLTTREAEFAQSLDQIPLGTLRNLISKLLQLNISVKEIPNHPALWTGEHMKHFLMDAHGHISKLAKEKEELTKDFDNSDIFYKGRWVAQLSHDLQDYLVSSNNVTAEGNQSPRSLLRAIRNIEAHCEDIPEKILQHIGEKTTQRMKFWDTTFPHFVMHVYEFCQGLHRTGVDSQDDTESMETDETEMDTTENTLDIKGSLEYECITAAYKGDIRKLRRLKEQGVNMGCADYDKRTPMHLATSEGRCEVLEFLIMECGIVPNFPDRWGETAVDIAKRLNNRELLTLFSATSQESAKERDFIQYAAEGCLSLIKKYHREGGNMEAADYDIRTALHVAAANGQSDVVRYLLEVCKVDPDRKDRWGNTASSEATKNNHHGIASLIGKYSRTGEGL